MFIRFTLALLIIFSSLPATAGPEQTVPQRVLFVGNSYLYYNDSLHNHVERMAIERHPNTPGSFAFTSATIGGVKLKHHNIDWLLAPEILALINPFTQSSCRGQALSHLPLRIERRS